MEEEIAAGENVILEDEELLSYPYRIIGAAFLYNLEKQKVIRDCDLKPSETVNKLYIYASNNKYDVEILNSEESGQWMIFPDWTEVDEVWDKVKKGVMSGDIWRTLVSTAYMRDDDGKHLINIYTKNFTDIEDIIKTLDYIESSGIIRPNQVIKYKTEKQTSGGVFSIFGQRSSIYQSDTIRQGIIYNTNNEQYMHFSFLNCDNSDKHCKLKPTDVLYTETPWLLARNDAYDFGGTFVHDGKLINRKFFGKWVIPTSEARVNFIWEKVKEGINEGYFWFAQVSTKKPSDPRYRIFIFNSDYTDIDEVISVLDNIEAMELINLHFNIKYESLAKQKQGDAHKINYNISSKTVRSNAFDKNFRNEDKDGYSFIYDVYAKEIISAGILKPSDALDECDRLMYAKNNKFIETEIKWRKVGSWAIPLHKDNVDKIWKLVKDGTMTGDLWYSKVTNFYQDKKEIDFILLVYCVNGYDQEDVIKTLNYLEGSGILSEDSIIKYNTNTPVSVLETKLACHKDPSYSSDTIRSVKKVFKNDNSNGSFGFSRHSQRSESSNNSNWRIRSIPSGSSSTSSTRNYSRNGNSSPPLSWRIRN